MNRPGFTYKNRTEYYKGTGTQKLLLRSRPVYPRVGQSDQIAVYLDEAGFYGSVSGAFTQSNSQLTYGTDFALQIDQEDGSSRSGILIRINNLWPRPQNRIAGLLSPFIGEGHGTIKVVYSAGYHIDNLPAQLRMAANLMVQRLRYIMPLGVELASESYEERAISVITSQKQKILALAAPIIAPFRNWKW
jgi:hypothetical protein